MLKIFLKIAKADQFGLDSSLYFFKVAESGIFCDLAKLMINNEYWYIYTLYQFTIIKTIGKVTSKIHLLNTISLYSPLDNSSSIIQTNI